MKRPHRIIIQALVMILACAIAATILAPQPAYADVKVTYFVVSEHFSGKEYNQYDHEFISFTVRTGDTGWEAGTYVNSFYKRSVFVSYTKYWSVSTNWEADVMFGAVIGYGNVNSCTYVCPFVSPGISYTRYPAIQPRFGIMGSALTLSVSYRF